MSNDRYVSPLSERYASREMQYIFSPAKSSEPGETLDRTGRDRKDWD